MTEVKTLKPINQNTISDSDKMNSVQITGTVGTELLSDNQETYTLTHSKTYVIEVKGAIDITSQNTTEGSIARLAIMLSDINLPGLTVGELGERIQNIETKNININVIEGDFPFKEVENMTERHRFNPEQNTLYAFNVVSAAKLIEAPNENLATNASVTQGLTQEMMIIRSTPAIEAVVMTGSNDPKLPEPAQKIQIQSTEPTLQVEMSGQAGPQPQSSNINWILSDPNFKLE